MNTDKQQIEELRAKLRSITEQRDAAQQTIDQVNRALLVRPGILLQDLPAAVRELREERDRLLATVTEAAR